MKKLYRKGTVHPSPPPNPNANGSDDFLSFLPAAIVSLAAALSPEDREVLAYLLLCNNASAGKSKKASSSSSGGGDHAPEFGCDCFRCYTTYWVRWGSSPNRQLIHEIIEAYEDRHNHDHSQDHLQSRKRGKHGKKERRKRGIGGGELNRTELVSSAPSDESLADSDSVVQPGGDGLEAEVDDEGLVSAEKGSNVRRLVSFIGERIWGVWASN